MQKPFDLVREMTPEQKHLEKAANFIRQLFSKHEPVKPNTQRLVTVKGRKVWRLYWNITEEYKRRAWIFSGLRPTKDDIKQRRRYVVDIYRDNTIIDYIIEPGQTKQKGDD